MADDVPIRVFHLIDKDGETVIDGIPQPLSDEIPDWITYQNRLFWPAARDDRADDPRQRYLCCEHPCLRAGSATINMGEETTAPF